MNRLQITAGGLTLRSPIVVASGPLTDSVEKVKQAEEHGAGAISTKLTLFPQDRPGVRKMYARNGSLFNPSDRRLQLEEGAELIASIKNVTHLPVFANISGGGNLESWITVGKTLAEAGADALELNFACPNLSPSDDASLLPHGGSLACYPDAAQTIIRSLKDNVAIPVWVKFSGERAPIPALVAAAEAGGADGLFPFYALRGSPPIDIYRGGRPALPGLDSCGSGGLNGACISAASNLVLSETATLTDLPLMGGGGVSTAEDVVEKLMFGASTVAVCTELILHGFSVLDRLNSDLLAFLDRTGHSSVSELTGLALPYLVGQGQVQAGKAVYAAVDEHRCIGCGRCASVGSCIAITVQDQRAHVEPENCEGCGLCASLCPKAAISFVPR